MWRRRRGGSTGLAVAVFILAVALTVSLAAVVAGRDRATAGWRLVVRDPEGVTLAHADLADGRFALRYRNSVYGSRAEERFAIGDDGRIHLVGLAADEVAVLGEYYAARAPRAAAEGDVFRWEAPPTNPVALERLLVAATDLGERTLVVDGRAPIVLWRLVRDASPVMSLGAERIR
jgi:hypothetical protein